MVNRKREFNLKFFTLWMIILIYGCSDFKESTRVPAIGVQSNTDNLIPEIYPLAEKDNELVYPVGIYPISTTNPDQQIILIEKPVTSKDKSVKGKGPAGLPLILVDVSLVGELLDETTVNSEGNFEFILDKPLEANHTIGVQLGDLQGTDFIETDFTTSSLFYDRPLVGILFDLVSVTE